MQESHKPEVKSPATPEMSVDENGTVEQWVIEAETSPVEDGLGHGGPASRETVLDRLHDTKGLLVDDDSRNVFAIASVLPGGPSFCERACFARSGRPVWLRGSLSRRDQSCCAVLPNSSVAPKGRLLVRLHLLWD